MTKNQLFLKTVFCCITCDREIYSDEVKLLKSLSESTDRFEGLEVEKLVNSFVCQINEKGALFLTEYLSELERFFLTIEEQLELIDLALKAIEADSKILAEEIDFFMRIRSRLSVSDAQIIDTFKSKPEIEDYLLLEIPAEDLSWSEKFDLIDLT